MKHPMGDLMEFAQREMQARLGESGFTDDWQWGDGCFQFVVVWDNERTTGPYRFTPYYDAEYEDIWGTDKEQLITWLDERF